jgi:hypothetical protein
MPFGGGFGPSTGRLVEVNESPDTRAAMTIRTVPPAASILALTAAFFGFLFGMTLLYENEKILGLVLLIAAVVLVALTVYWTIKNQ